jgi:transposase
MRTVALDVHKRFVEVAVHEDGAVRRLGRIETTQLREFAASLGATDHVVLESTAMTWAIAVLLSRHAGRVTVSNPMRTRAIASAKVKTDKIDAKVLAQLGAADFLPGVWAPDEVTRALRRRVAHRSRLVVQRTRLRNQIHAVLTRNLIDAPMSDVFGQGARAWLADVVLADHEREQVDSDLRLHDALNHEIELAVRCVCELTPNARYATPRPRRPHHTASYSPAASPTPCTATRGPAAHAGDLPALVAPGV